MSEIIDSDIIDLAGREVWVTAHEGDVDVQDAVTVTVVDRSYPTGPLVSKALVLGPDDAHQLGNKLRLAARKVRGSAAAREDPQPSD